MDFMSRLVQNIVDISYEDLPVEVIDFTKKCIIDTFGAAMAGTTALGCKTVVDQVKEWGGKKDSTIINYGGKAPAHNVVIANGMMARAVELDDCHESSGQHPSVVTVPTAFAMAEQQGGRSGKDIIVAISLGSDLMCRMRMACKRPLAVTPWALSVYAPFWRSCSCQ